MPRVLVVEDDTSIRQLLTASLRDEGFEVSEAAEGSAAPNVLQNWSPDVILLDMKMPGMDGWEFLKVYRRKHTPQVPIIVVTASIDAAARAAEVGIDFCIAKPFHLNALIEPVTSEAKHGYAS